MNRNCNNIRFIETKLKWLIVDGHPCYLLINLFFNKLRVTQIEGQSVSTSKNFVNASKSIYSQTVNKNYGIFYM